MNWPPSLYGTTLAQSIVYFRSFSGDSTKMKLLVSFLCTVDTLHVCLLGDMFWDTLIYGRLPDHAVSSSMPWQLLASFIVESLLTSIVQCFFCLRVWKVGKNWILTSIIGITTATQFWSGNAFTIHNFFKTTTAAALLNNTFVQLQMISSMICDITISASLVYYFRTLQVGMRRTDSVLQQLVVLSVNVGALLSLVTGVSLILFEVKAATYCSLAPQFILTRLYVNSMMATLNSRKHFREVVDRSIGYSISPISMSTTTPTFQVYVEP